MKRRLSFLPGVFWAALLSVLPAGAAAASDPNVQFTVYGEGVSSCAEYLENDRKGNRRLQLEIAWLVGFISAAGAYNDTEKQLGDVADGHGIVHLIREYCELHPLKHLSKAAHVVAAKLIEKAGGDVFRHDRGIE